MLDNYANEMLKKQDQVESLVNRSVENKLSAALKECREVEPQRNQRRGFQQVVRLIRAGQV